MTLKIIKEKQPNDVFWVHGWIPVKLIERAGEYWLVNALVDYHDRKYSNGKGYKPVQYFKGESLKLKGRDLYPYPNKKSQFKNYWVYESALKMKVT